MVRGVTAAAHVVPCDRGAVLPALAGGGLRPAESAQGTNDPADRRLCSRCCWLGRADGRAGRNRSFTGVLRDGRSSAHDPRRCASRPRSPPPPTGRRFSRSDRSYARGRVPDDAGRELRGRLRQRGVVLPGRLGHRGGRRCVRDRRRREWLTLAHDCPSRLGATPWPRSDQLRPVSVALADDRVAHSRAIGHGWPCTRRDSGRRHLWLRARVVRHRRTTDSTPVTLTRCGAACSLCCDDPHRVGHRRRDRRVDHQPTRSGCGLRDCRSHTIAQLGQRVTYEHDGAAARLVRCRHADLHDDRLRAGRIDRPGRRLGCRIPRYGDARRLHRCRLHLL